MASKSFRRSDDQRPGSGFRLVLPDGRVVFLAKDEIPGAAQIAEAHKIMNDSPEEISSAVIKWLTEYRQSKKFFQR